MNDLHMTSPALTPASLLPVNTPQPLASHRHFAEATYVAGKMTLALRQRNLPAVFERFILTETQQRLIWLIGVLDKDRIGKIDPYAAEATLHQISTLVGGKPTVWSNTTGVRYAVLLAGQPQLPERVDYPELWQGGLPLGETLRGPLEIPWESARNLLITGTQGAGKSAFLTGAANVAWRQGHELYLIDPELHTFGPEAWGNRVAAPVASSEGEVRAILRTLDAELERRSNLYREVAGSGRPPEDLDEYNSLSASRLPRLVLIMDEANDFFEDKAIVEQLTLLARHGRKWGLHIILAAHNWRARDVPRSLSARFPSRIAFRVDDGTSALVVLEDHALAKQAMKLRQAGRGLVKLAGAGTTVCQTYYLTAAQEQSWLALAPARPVESAPAASLGQTPGHPAPRRTLPNEQAFTRLCGKGQPGAHKLAVHLLQLGFGTAKVGDFLPFASAEARQFAKDVRASLRAVTGQKPAPGDALERKLVGQLLSLGAPLPRIAALLDGNNAENLERISGYGAPEARHV